MKTYTESVDAVSAITKERGDSYGHPLTDFTRVAKMTEVIAECPDPQIRHALNMIAVKICCLIETPDHKDSIVDITGYARTIAMICDRRELERDQGKLPLKGSSNANE